MQTLQEKFWRQVDKSGDCWRWTGSLDRKGYGKFYAPGGKCWKLAHRVSYSLSCGVLRNDTILHHECSNRWCVNPSHLRPMTQQEHSAIHAVSVMPCVSANSWAGRSVCRRGHPLTEENIGSRKDGSRYCRACRRAVRNLRERNERATKNQGV